MEDIVYLGIGRQLQPIGHGPDALHHLERPVEALGQFSWATCRYAGRRPVMQAQPRPLTHSELNVAPVLVMLRLHDILCEEETFPYLLQELVAIPELAIDGGHPSQPRRVAK